jgi:hypothetical protein
MVVDGIDRRIGTVPFGFGCEPEHDEPGDQPAGPGDERQQPGTSDRQHSGAALAER